MRRVWVIIVGLAVVASVMTGAASATADASEASEEQPWVGVERPRTSYTPGTEAMLVDRLTREPYRQIFLDAHALHEARRLSRTPGDPDRHAQKDMARSARWFAFEYALDRTVIDGEIVPFPDDEAREATGAIVEELLLGAYERSRIAVPPPLGGWDRDIDTAGEIVQWTSAFDLMLGAGYEFADGSDATIAARLTELTAELYRNYTDPATANGFTDLHQNNHRTKSGIAFAMAAATLAEYAPDPADDPDGSRDPVEWWDLGVTLVDDTLRHVLLAGDGAYSEGTHYYRFTTESVAVYVGMWERLLGDGAWTNSAGREIPALHHTELFARSADWMLAMTLPDGSQAPVDDANTAESYFFGALPPLPNAAAYAWRWANAPTPYVNESSTDLALDSIVAYDDAIVPAPPDGSPTSFWYEGGNAIFRSDWDPEAMVVIAQGEGPTASLFGRDASGLGRTPQSHEHAEPGSYILAAHGETLVLDPGYLSFLERSRVATPGDHSIVLVDGEGPREPLPTSFEWGSTDPYGTPPQDGFATIHSTLDTERLDTAVVTTRYGAHESGTDIELDRRFLFVDDRYLVIADEITPLTPADTTPADPVDLTWVVQGNGGGTSGGTFTPTATGGIWSRADAALEAAIVTDQGLPAFTTEIQEHEDPTRRRNELTHETLHATVDSAEPVRAIQVLVPTATGATPAAVTTSWGPDGLTATIDDSAAGRVGTVVWDDDGLRLVDADDADPNDAVAWTTGDALADGSVSAPGARQLVVDGQDDRRTVAADRPAHSIVVADVDPAWTADGACASDDDGAGTRRLEPGTNGTVSLRPATGNNGPSALLVHRYQRAELGTALVLDASGSCDPDGDALSAEWTMTSAPRGSSWSLDPSDPWRPVLDVDATGTYRLTLTVRDSSGATSTADVEIAAGDRCFDERDDDLDGRFDGADPDCDGTEPAPTADATGFVLTDIGYLDSVTSGLDGVEVGRHPDGAVDTVRGFGIDDGKILAVVARIDGDSADGVVVVVDLEAGVFRTGIWSGRIVEPRPGVLVGVDDESSTHWIVVDRPLSGS
ncbi:MAG: heparinase II/III family protein [Acidimicrobiales bacterium]|nr:heparinase II/III family protein [Acidimicrobiales bacterium]